jgi:hypothetical protein
MMYFVPYVEFYMTTSIEESITYDLFQLPKRSTIVSSLTLYNLLQLGCNVGNFCFTKPLASLTVISKFSFNRFSIIFAIILKVILLWSALVALPK